MPDCRKSHLIFQKFSGRGPQTHRRRSRLRRPVGASPPYRASPFHNFWIRPWYSYIVVCKPLQYHCYRSLEAYFLPKNAPKSFGDRVLSGVHSDLRVDLLQGVGPGPGNGKGVNEKGKSPGRRMDSHDFETWLRQ